jgi:hypothetical protein
MARSESMSFCIPGIVFSFVPIMRGHGAGHKIIQVPFAENQWFH